ncbi:MAG: hypothetical protein KIT31_10695 [Deltaproteobacteria bacterium]|nr:hypothetical protein [Deltaproteobacteria bacterium]
MFRAELDATTAPPGLEIALRFPADVHSLARATTNSSDVVAHPFAVLVVRERAVPLDHDITQFGNIPLATAKRFGISRVAIEGTSTSARKVDISGAFAPGQFTQLRADERLTAPSFEQMHAGVQVGGDEVRTGAIARTSMDLVTVVEDPLAPPEHVSPTFVMPAQLAALAVALRRPSTPPPRAAVRFSELAYVLASTNDLAPTAEGAAIARGATTFATLREALRARGGSPSLQIVPRAVA